MKINNILYLALSPLRFGRQGRSDASIAGLASLIRILIGLLGFAWAEDALGADYYVSPNGTGNGTSAQTPAGYLDHANFWQTTVKNALETGNVTVWFARDIYSRGALELADFGSPINTLTIAAQTGTAAFEMRNDAGGVILSIRGGQRITVQDFVFTGDVSSVATSVTNGVNSSKNLSRWINFVRCKWQNLENLSYGALNITYGSQNITVDDCDFINVGPTASVHMIYCYWNPCLLTIKGSRFTDNKGDYIRFRADADYAIVKNCTFTSTGTSHDWGFLRVAVYNDFNPGNEFLGGNFQFNGNVFTWASTSTDAARRYGTSFMATGHNVISPLDYMLTSAENATLTSGTPAEKNALLSSEMSLDYANIKIYNNTYANQAGKVNYTHARGSLPTFAEVVTQGGSGLCDISNWADTNTNGQLAEIPLLRNGDFEFAGDRRRCWSLVNCVPPRDHEGLADSGQAVRLAKTEESAMWQCINNYDPNPPQGAPKDPLLSTLSIQWQVAIGNDFVAGQNSGDVVYQTRIYHNELKNACLIVAVDNIGNVGYINSSGAFVPVTALGTMKFATDGDGDGNYSGSGDTLKWHQFRVDIDYSGAQPKFTIFLGNQGVADSYAKTSGDITVTTAWSGQAPVTGDHPSSIHFSNYGANVVVDTVRKH